MIISNEEILIKIIINKNLKEINKIFEENEIIIEKLNYLKKTLFYLINEKISIDIIKFFINQQKILWKHQNVDNNDLLYYSIENSNFKVASIFLRYGAQISNNKKNIIEYLLEKEKLDSEKLLFVLNNVKNASVCNPEILYKLLDKNKINILREIFQYKFYDINFILNMLLIYKNKITFSNKELLEYFYNNNKSLLKINDPGGMFNKNMLCNILSYKNYIKNIKLLFDYANYNNIIIDVNTYTYSNRHPLDIIAELNSIEAFDMLIEYANKYNIILDINNKYSTENFPLKEIFYNNNIEMLKKYIEYAEEKDILINLNVIRVRMNSIIRYIAKCNSIEIFKILIKYAKKHGIIMKYFRGNNVILDLCDETTKHNILNIIENNEDIFEYVN